MFDIGDVQYFQSVGISDECITELNSYVSRVAERCGDFGHIPRIQRIGNIDDFQTVIRANEYVVTDNLDAARADQFTVRIVYCAAFQEIVPRYSVHKSIDVDGDQTFDAVGYKRITEQRSDRYLFVFRKLNAFWIHGNRRTDRNTGGIFGPDVESLTKR